MNRPIDIALAVAKKRGLNQSRFASRVGATPSDITNWKNRGMPPERHQHVARILGLSVDELLGLKETVEPDPRSTGVAHGMSFEAFTVPSSFPWEGLKMVRKEELLESFRVAMPDAALKGDIEEGAELVFECGAARAGPGKCVLVQDGEGNRFVRRFAAVRGTHWRAISSNGFFDPLDSVEHKLEVLAVMRWRED